MLPVQPPCGSCQPSPHRTQLPLTTACPRKYIRTPECTQNPYPSFPNHLTSQRLSDRKTGHQSTPTMSAQSAMPTVEAREGTLDDFILELGEYPEGSLRFSGLDETISKDGASIRLTSLAALYTEEKGVKKADGIACQAASRLFPNAGANAFPPEMAHEFLLSVKVELAGVTHKREGIVLSQYFIVPAGAAVGRLCYRIAREYESLLEVCSSLSSKRCGTLGTHGHSCLVRQEARRYSVLRHSSRSQHQGCPSLCNRPHGG